ncbi:hypothetical protein LCGC14_1868820 [marine sediment metagenome]|uniref:Uncharacterized protein n=1 Tax=marine sediment metagenome TaxID=412755 RepID=A0A0F9G5M8_9ZZZZ
MSNAEEYEQAFIEVLSLEGLATYHPRTANYCSFCNKPAGEFNDRLSKKEFTISGLCQECQDETFE